MWGLIIVGMLFVFIGYSFVFYFNRDPKRDIPRGNVLVAPADGRIVDIVELKKGVRRVPKGFIGSVPTNLKKNSWLISIFMSPLDVHVQRSPVGGKIKSVKHLPGSFKNAMSLAALENERTEIVIQTKKNWDLVVYKIAGFLTRRIESFVNRGVTVKKGDKIGRILLGSQVSMIVPKSKVKLCVKKGMRTIAGETIMGDVRG